MAKITVNYDTENKDLSMSIDGQDQGPVESVLFERNEYSDGGVTGFMEARLKPKEENGVSMMMRASAEKIEKVDTIEQIARSCLSKK